MVPYQFIWSHFQLPRLFLKKFVIFCYNQGIKDYLLPLHFSKLAKKSITILHNHKLDTKLCVNLSNSTLRSVSNMSFLLLLFCEQRLPSYNKLKMIWVMFLLKLIWYIPDILNDLFACTASHEKNEIAGLKTTSLM